MKVLNDKELYSLEQFFTCSQEELLKALTVFLKKRYKKVISTPNYIIAVGDIPVALVAHLDTVFHYGQRDIYYDRVKNVIWSPDGLGADDRAGVYGIIQILKSKLCPTIIFTTEEERGAIGASTLTKDFAVAPTDLKYIIELDRQGYNDCVFYDCDNSAFEKYVEGFGFNTAMGTFSDISIICPAWQIAGVNLSVGYRNEHSCSEILMIDVLYDTINKIIKMLKQADNADIFKYIPVSEHNWLSRYLKAYNQGDLVRCEGCNTRCSEYELYPVEMTDISGEAYLCGNCLAGASWCLKCGHPFLLDHIDYQYICKKCKEKE